MFANSTQELFSSGGVPGDQVTCTSEDITTELALVMDKARIRHTKVKTHPKLNLQAALLASRLKQELC